MTRLEVKKFIKLKPSIAQNKKTARRLPHLILKDFLYANFRLATIYEIKTIAIVVTLNTIPKLITTDTNSGKSDMVAHIRVTVITAMMGCPDLDLQDKALNRIPSLATAEIARAFKAKRTTMVVSSERTAAIPINFVSHSAPAI